MGVDAADFNSDGWEDLFVDNIGLETFSLCHNRRNGTFAGWRPLGVLYFGAGCIPNA
jgi:hypothetical protein